MRRERGIIVVGVLMLLTAGTLLVIAWLGRLGPGNRSARGFLQDGTELVAVLVATSTCGFSAAPEAPSAVAEATAALQKRAEQEDKHFVYIGVGLDHNPVEAVRFLKRFGPFNEVLAGRGWLNTGSIAFMIRDLPGPVITPQLIVFERDIVAGNTAISITPDRIVGRYVGLAAIRQKARDVMLSSEEALR